MTDILIPQQLGIASSSIRYIDNTGMSIGAFTGVARTAGLGGDRLGAALNFVVAGGKTTDGMANRAAIQAFIARLRGRQNRVYMPDASYTRRGAFPSAELIGNNVFASGLTGWAASSSNIVLKSSQRTLRSVRASVSGDETVRATAVTVTNGAAYAIRAMVNIGKGAVNFRLRAGSSAGGNDLGTDSSDRTADGMATLAFVVSGTTLNLSIVDRNTGKSIGDFMDIAYVSCARCALVNGASQTGSALLLKNLPVSTDDLLLPGDQFEVITSNGSELKIVTAPLHSDSSGYGYVRFEPALRGSVADGAAVILTNPMGRFVLRNANPEWSNEPGVFTRSSIELDEAA